jgi:ArsR family transcriptional regulator, arsenate/arsenite/antimonite-responsive transcriptional repressor / arsenate reductase (thioredoxin)
MSSEWNADLRRRAAVYGALAEPARLAVVDELTFGDRSPGELAEALGLPSNLLAHHLNVLEEAGLVARSRSEADRRRTYLRLMADALAASVPAVALAAPRVVFVCTHNSARSQFAAALWARRSRVPAASAGTRPATRVHRTAVRVAHRHGLSLRDARTARTADVVRPGDLLVAVCDSAYEELGGGGQRLHWSVPDPVAAGTTVAFEQAYTDLEQRVDRLAPVVRLPHGETGVRAQ